MKEYQKEYQKKYQNKYRSLSEDEKDIKRQYQKATCHNMSDQEKQRLKDYQKKQTSQHERLTKTKIIILSKNRYRNMSDEQKQKY